MKIFNFKFSILKSILVQFLFIFYIIILNLPLSVIAQTITEIPYPDNTSPTQSQEDIEIESLKEKIATKVAELREKNLKAISGSVTSVDDADGSLIIKTGKGEDFEINVDSDLTKYFQISDNLKKETTSAKVKKDSYIIATGLIKDRVIEANFIYIDEE